LDKFAPSINTEIHIQNNEIQKTYSGSFFYILMFSLIVSIALSQGLDMVHLKNPN